MDAALLNRILSTLWPPGEHSESAPVFAMLDGARDRRIEPMVRFSRRQYRCLYSGELSPALAAAAPYVVYLARDSTFTRELIEASWGRSWGVFLIGTADCTHEQVRRHFRRYLKVRTEDGQVLLFRFYDPRVLPRYVGACDAIQAEQFFGPVTKFVLEDGRAEVLELSNPVISARSNGAPKQAQSARVLQPRP